MDCKKGFCGLNCAKCPLYVARLLKDYHMMEEIAYELNRRYGLNVKPSEAHCTGCSETEGVFRNCAKCSRRLCCMEKGLESCKKCPEYPCSLYDGFDIRDTFAHQNRIEYY